MKKLYFILIGFLVFGAVDAQIINIPDAAFKVMLLGANTGNTTAKKLNGNYFKIDANNDGEIQISEALQVYYLDIGYSGIADSTGIEYFTNLTYLTCHDNWLTSINVSSLTNLQTLQCNGNQIMSLDASSLINLRDLDCSGDQLLSLNVSGLTNLKLYIVMLINFQV